MTGSAFRAVAPVSAVCAAFAAQSSVYPQSTRKPDGAPACRSAAKNETGDKMSTEFYCEEFPAELQHRSRSACGRLSAEREAASGEAGESQGVVRAPWQTHLPAVRAVLSGKNGAFLRG